MMEKDARGLTGNLCDAEDARNDGRYSTQRAKEARGLFAALDVAPDTDSRVDGALAQKYRFPPFSVLNARDGEWQRRKNAWINLGIKSELGRSGAVLVQPEPSRYQLPSLDDDDLIPMTSVPSRTTTRDPNAEQTGTSIFDPVLTECCILWYSGVGMTILDPFAGGSVRGVVAEMLGRKYCGVDLREDQIRANQSQVPEINRQTNRELSPRWIVGDSREIRSLTQYEPFADYILTCPPYGNLERYSDDPRDISTLGYSGFFAAYSEIIQQTCTLLKPDRFATCVVGEIREKENGHGEYRGLVPDTIAAFESAGLKYYNEQILVTMVGSLPLRVALPFDGSRKCGKSHQNVLTFVKGDPERAAKACGPVLAFDPLSKRRSR